MKKLLFVIPRMRCGGAEKVIAWLANSLADNYSVTVYSLQNVPSFYPLKDTIIYKTGKATITSNNYYLRAIERLLSAPKSLLLLKRLMADEQYDLVLPFTYSADILVGIIGLFDANLRFICSERNDPNQIPKIKYLLLKQIYRRAKHFVCQSKAVYDFYEGIVENRTIIPNSIDLSHIPQKSECDKSRIVAVGRLDYQKNYELLISCFSECLREGVKCRLEIYGDGTRKASIAKLIKSLNIENYVMLKGVTANITEKINNAYLLVMASRYEGFPNVFLEAMSVGVPIVTTDFSPGTAREILEDGVGIVVENESKEELKEAIIRLFNNEKRRNDMSDKCIMEVKKYDNKKVYPMWKKVIETSIT